MRVILCPQSPPPEQASQVEVIIELNDFLVESRPFRKTLSVIRNHFDNTFLDNHFVSKQIDVDSEFRILKLNWVLIIDVSVPDGKIEEV
jgi:hypothetical protein